MVRSLEDAKDYKAFEAAITADYDVEMAVARELVLRLASLWRLRRAAAIEAYLFEIQTESLAPHQVEIGRPPRSAKHPSIMPSNRRSAMRTANGSNLTITSPSSTRSASAA